MYHTITIIKDFGGTMENQYKYLILGLCGGIAVGILAAPLLFKQISNSSSQQEDTSDQPEINTELLPKYKYSLHDTVQVNGRQGVATDGKYYWVSGSKTLAKYDMNWNLIAENDDPFAGYEVEVNHCGDIDVYQNEIYVSAEYFMDGVGKNIQMAVYDGDTLKLKRTFIFQSDSGQLECSGITVNPDDRLIVMCSWVGEESGRYLYEYSLDTGAYIRKVHLQMPPQWLQGICYHDGYYYMTADDGTADDNEPDHIYRTAFRPDDTAATVVLEDTLDNVKLQGEIEGLTFNPDTDQMLVLYNRGSQIVLGMVKGFYPGYTEEIHEVYLYDRTSYLPSDAQ